MSKHVVKFRGSILGARLWTGLVASTSAATFGLAYGLRIEHAVISQLFGFLVGIGVSLALWASRYEVVMRRRLRRELEG